MMNNPNKLGLMTSVAAEAASSWRSSRVSNRPRRCWASPKRRSEEHTSELQSLMRNSYAVFCLKKKKTNNIINLQHINKIRNSANLYIKYIIQEHNINKTH